MSERSPVPREDARAVLEARRELGPAYEAELAERFAARVEAQLDRRPAHAALTTEQRTGIAIVSLGASIPLLAIAGNFAGLAGIIVVAIAVVLVNVAARR